MWGILLNVWKSLFGSSGILVVGLHEAYCYSSFAPIFWDDRPTVCPAGCRCFTGVNKGTAKVARCILNSLKFYIFCFCFLFSNIFASQLKYFTYFNLKNTTGNIKLPLLAHKRTQTHICLSVIISSCPWEPLTTLNNVRPVLSLASSAVPWQQLIHTSRLQGSERKRHPHCKVWAQANKEIAWLWSNLKIMEKAHFQFSHSWVFFFFPFLQGGGGGVLGGRQRYIWPKAKHRR